jgi:hypothetical protein
MNKKLHFTVVLIFVFNAIYGQIRREHLSVGFSFGFGNEFKNDDYTFTNQYYKLELNYLLRKEKFFQYEIVIQPEINFAEHQLINPYFITPDDPDYIEKRERFSKKYAINQYILNLGIILRKPISKSINAFFLASTGPMISDGETERLAKGFAFSNVVAFGVSYKVKRFEFDVRPNVRHVSNAGLSSPNIGFNTKNIEFGVSLHF